jgi:hypothetical protein
LKGWLLLAAARVSGVCAFHRRRWPVAEAGDTLVWGSLAAPYHRQARVAPSSILPCVPRLLLVLP